MERRSFLALAGGVLLAGPARAQQREAVRLIGVLSAVRPDDPEAQRRDEAFVQRLEQLGWRVGVNLRIERRWSQGDSDLLRKHAVELMAMKPDMVLATSGVAILPLMDASSTIPIVFAQSIDPVGLGVVESLSRPGGNVTGFTQFEYGIAAKWLELMRELVPGLLRVAVLRDPFDPAGIGQWAAIQSVAPAMEVELGVVNVRDPAAIERSVGRFAGQPNGGLIITASSPASVHRKLILDLAEKHRLPTVFPYRFFAAAGALACYGPETIEQYRRAAAYVSRILKGERPGDLPVQAPSQYELVINLKTAKALGLAVPQTLLARANEVIE